MGYPVFGVKELLSLSGRMTRAKYFTISLLSGFIFFGLAAILDAVWKGASKEVQFIIAIPLGLIWWWVMVVIIVKRLHDIDKTGWFWLIIFIPLANAILGIFLLFKKGTDGPNKYGPDPLKKDIDVNWYKNGRSMEKYASQKPFLQAAYDESQKDHLHSTEQHANLPTIKNINLAEATRILKFHTGSENKYINQIKFMKAVIEKQQYPNMEITAMKRTNPSATCEYLILETGTKNEYQRKMNPKVEEEIFQRVHPGEDWEIMWADGTVINTAPQGSTLESIEPFNAIMNEIKNGFYDIIEIISKEGQSSQLNAIEKSGYSKLEDLSKNGVLCSNCNARHSLSQVINPSVFQDDGINFRCPSCNRMALYIPEMDG